MLGTFDEGIAMSLHNDPTGVNAYTRRLFLGKSLAFASAAATVPTTTDQLSRKSAVFRVATSLSYN